jgi:RHS repeat-associated protein
LRAGDQLLEQGSPSQPEDRIHFHGDEIGSIRSLTNSDGQVVSRYQYSPFGERELVEGSDRTPYGFSGEPLQQDLGWSFHRARWLAPSLGSFVSMDPFTGFLDQPQSLHRYTYADLDPINRVDPSGQFTVAQRAVVGGVMGALITSQVAPLAGYALGQTTTTAEASGAARWGFVLGAAAALSPIAAVAVGLYVLVLALKLLNTVLNRPNATDGQKLAAYGIVGLSLFAVFSGFSQLRAQPKGSNPSPEVPGGKGGRPSGNDPVGNPQFEGPQPTQLQIHPDIVARYVRQLKAGEQLKPIEIVRLPDGREFILDGHHRFVASEQTGIPVGRAVFPGEGPVGLSWSDVLYERFHVEGSF